MVVVDSEVESAADWVEVSGPAMVQEALEEALAHKTHKEQEVAYPEAQPLLTQMKEDEIVHLAVDIISDKRSVQ